MSEPGASAPGASAPGASAPGASAAGVSAAFLARAARAELLERSAPVAAELLRFAAGLNRAQAAGAARLAGLHGREPLRGQRQDVQRLAGPSEVLRFIAEAAPVPLAELARARLADPAGALEALQLYWDGGGPGPVDYLARAVLRPLFAVLSALEIAPQRPHAPQGCAFCGGLPWIASRRPAGQSEGTPRFLGCALCAREWQINRIRCAGCGEEDPVKLPSFQVDLYPLVRVEACEACKGYLKSIDLSIDGRPIPEVDDLLSIGVDLWAAEQGYARIEPGMGGI